MDEISSLSTHASMSSSDFDSIGPTTHDEPVLLPTYTPSWVTVLTCPFDVTRNIVEFLHERDVFSLFHPRLVHECDMIPRNR